MPLLLPRIDAPEGCRVYLRPMGLVPAPGEWSLAGGRFAFSLAELIVRDGARIQRAVASVSEILAWGHQQHEAVALRLATLLVALTRPRPAVAGLDLDRPRLMAVLNVTPDSFSDGGAYLSPKQAIAHGLSLLAGGSDLIDIGGESTRPGAAPVPVEEELRRVLPVVEALAARGARLSIDTRHARVMRAALVAGVSLVNDVSGLTGDDESLDIVAGSRVPVVLMHMQGDPRRMQEAPCYADAALDVFDWLEGRVAACVAVGIAPERIVVDPGIGFGKTIAHNIEILRQLTLFHGLGTAVLVGASRKRFIAALSRDEPVTERLPGSVASSLDALSQGVQMLRIHDFAAFIQARAVWEALHPQR